MSASTDKIKQDKKPHYAGHRQRQRDKFKNDLGVNMADYEILELLLFQLIQRRDVKPLAKDLLGKYKTLSNRFNANPTELIEFSGLSENTAYGLRLIKHIAQKISHEKLHEKEVLSSLSSLIDYVRLSIRDYTVEEFRVIYLNQSNHVLRDETINQGTVNEAPVYPREVIKKALNCGATAVILVHNHPSENPAPSIEDVEVTNKLKSKLAAVDVEIHDHIIVCSNDYFSFAQHSML